MNIKELEKMNWKEFIDLEEVQVDESPSGQGGAALFYNDGNVKVSIDVESKAVDESGAVIEDSPGHDDWSIWNDEELAKELQALAIEEMKELED